MKHEGDIDWDRVGVLQLVLVDSIEIKLEAVDGDGDENAPPRLGVEVRRPPRCLRFDRCAKSVEGAEKLEVGLDLVDGDEGGVLTVDSVRRREVDEGRREFVDGV